ncbi:RipA family octameric membrane protein [Amycolatopsis sp. NBC_01286]|uniref:RipA family octameric membrane protein n=1 Tax=Amycolatopsis sp. NBC_01286 TaxID=2903560 RepID=UPI002E0D3D55|nr:hypothetical protein OG570_28640 [Amycolatopsis sp. NBC_01286]
MTFGSRIQAYFRHDRVDLAHIKNSLWNTDVDAASYQQGGEKYQEAILEQYKIYTENADRASARRSLTNTFFLLANTGILTFATSFNGSTPGHPIWGAYLLLVLLLVQCATWYWILRSYRQLMSAKFRVIAALEERLPASPYWRAEWTALGSGKNKARYWPLTKVEQGVPLLFGVAYLSLLVAEVLF